MEGSALMQRQSMIRRFDIAMLRLSFELWVNIGLMLLLSRDVSEGARDQQQVIKKKTELNKTQWTSAAIRNSVSPASQPRVEEVLSPLLSNSERCVLTASRLQSTVDGCMFFVFLFFQSLCTEVSLREADGKMCSINVAAWLFKGLSEQKGNLNLSHCLY